jgi:hypothetical protein
MITRRKFAQILAGIAGALSLTPQAKAKPLEVTETAKAIGGDGFVKAINYTKPAGGCILIGEPIIYGEPPEDMGKPILGLPWNTVKYRVVFRFDEFARVFVKTTKDFRCYYLKRDGEFFLRVAFEAMGSNRKPHTTYTGERIETALDKLAGIVDYRVRDGDGRKEALRLIDDVRAAIL